jgi:hypothetical protein
MKYDQPCEKMIRVVPLTIFWIIFSIACSSTRVDLIEQGKYSVELINPDGYEVSTSAFADKGELVVSGVISRNDRRSHRTRNRQHRHINGHVEILLVSTEGRLIKSVRIDYQPLHSVHVSSGDSTFKVRISTLPPKGTKLIFKHFVD